MKRKYSKPKLEKREILSSVTANGPGFSPGGNAEAVF